VTNVVQHLDEEDYRRKVGWHPCHTKPIRLYGFSPLKGRVCMWLLQDTAMHG